MKQNLKIYEEADQPKPEGAKLFKEFVKIANLGSYSGYRIGIYYPFLHYPIVFH